MAKQRKQVAAAEQKQKSLNIKLTEKQALFLQCNTKLVLYGGAAGGGKSYAQLVGALIFACNYAGSRQLILRETYPELERSLITGSRNLYPEDTFEYNGTDRRWTNIFNKSIIEFGYCASMDDAYKYKSSEYDVIRIDEASEMSEDRIRYLTSRIRGTNRDIPKQLLLSTNPGGTGHKFLKAHFRIGVEKPNEPFNVFIGKDPETGEEKWESRCYIPARVYDNIFIMENDPDYITNLMQLPEKERKALLEGSWEIYDDQAFPEFDYETHTCDSFPIPLHWKRWRSADNGYDDPFAWYWHAVSEDGTVYTYREYTRNEKDPKVIYKEQAERVTELSTCVDINNPRMGSIPEKIMYTVVGHDAFASHVRDAAGKELVDYYSEGGVYNCIKTLTDRRLRKAVVHEYLKAYKDENTGLMTAKWMIFRDCKVLIQKIPDTRKDPRDNEKYFDEDNHWQDGAFYGILSYHANKSRGSSPEKSSIEKDKEKLWKQLRNKRFG
jgi:hypothetical protein